MSRETLAVLVPYHNEGRLLTRCLESFRTQSRPIDEVLVYDDASTTRPEPFLVSGLPVRVIRGSVNVGPAQGRNRLLAESRAGIVHFHDADDTVTPEWSAKVSEAFAAGDVDVVFTEAASITEDGRRTERVLELDALAGGADLTAFSIQHALLPAAGTYRRQRIEVIGGYRESLWQSEDWDFHIRLAASKARYRVIPESLAVVHTRSTSRSHETVQVWTSAVAAIEQLSTELPARYRQHLSEAAAKAGSHLYRAGARKAAREAFALAERLGRPLHAGQSRVYRTLARHAGQECAERVGRAYRKVLPAHLRRRLTPWR